VQKRETAVVIAGAHAKPVAASIKSRQRQQYDVDGSRRKLLTGCHVGFRNAIAIVAQRGARLPCREPQHICIRDDRQTINLIARTQVREYGVQRHLACDRPVTGDARIDEKFRQLLERGKQSVGCSKALAGRKLRAHTAQAFAQFGAIRSKAHARAEPKKNVASSAVPVRTERP